MLGGVEIPHEKGSLGHSDGDALLHALCDAILGAIGAGDIGRHFPDNDPKYKDVASVLLLQHVVGLLDRQGFITHNIDCTIVLEQPKLMVYTNAMIANIAGVLRVPAEMVSIKVKTNEGMGFVGRGEGVAAFAVVTVKEKGA